MALAGRDKAALRSSDGRTVDAASIDGRGPPQGLRRAVLKMVRNVTLRSFESVGVAVLIVHHTPHVRLAVARPLQDYAGMAQITNMGTVNCHDCGKLVSFSASACPSCGSRTPAGPPRRTRRAPRRINIEGTNDHVLACTTLALGLRPG